MRESDLRVTSMTLISRSRVREGDGRGVVSLHASKRCKLILYTRDGLYQGIVGGTIISLAVFLSGHA